MKSIAIRLIAIVICYFIAYYVAIYFGLGYGYLFPKSLGAGSMLPVAATAWFRGISLASIFFVTFAMSLLNTNNKLWWVTVPLLPAIAYELFIDPSHLYVPIVLGLGGWVLANKLR